MKSKLDPRAANALVAFSQQCRTEELLEYRRVAAELHDARVGDLPETALLLLTHRHGLAGEIDRLPRTPVSAAALGRLQRMMQSRLRIASPEAVHYVVAAWVKAFGKHPSGITQRSVRRVANLRNHLSQMRAMATAAAVAMLLAVVVAGASMRGLAFSDLAGAKGDTTERVEESMAAASPPQTVLEAAASSQPLREKILPESTGGTADRRDELAEAQVSNPAAAPTAAHTMPTSTAAQQSSAEMSMSWEELRWQLDGSPDVEPLLEWDPKFYRFFPTPAGGLTFVERHCSLRFDRLSGKYQLIAKHAEARSFRRQEYRLFPAAVGLATEFGDETFTLAYYYPHQEIRVLKLVKGMFPQEVDVISYIANYFVYDAETEIGGKWYRLSKEAPIRRIRGSALSDVRDRQELLSTFYDSALLEKMADRFAVPTLQPRVDSQATSRNYSGINPTFFDRTAMEKVISRREL